MWSRREIKTRAKDVLRTSYWKAFLISLVLAFVGGGGGGVSFNFPDPFSKSDPVNSSSSDLGSLFTSDGFNPFILLIVGVIFLVAMLFVAGVRIFLGYPLEVGGRRYFNRAAQDEVNMGFLGYAFDKYRYWGVIKSMLWRALINFLWFLLLIIPGIIKSYAYQMVPFILADNPNIGHKRALELSKQMTDGQKWRMFVLDLSFIGWYLLGFLLLFVGILFVLPYDNATRSELYLILRQKALDSGLSHPDELLIQPPNLVY
jgi:hypothetical protein